MNDLSFVENYKRIREKFNAPRSKHIAIPTIEEVVPTVEPPSYRPPENITTLKVMQDPELRGYLRKVVLLEEGITYRQALLKGAEDIPKRIKLAILPILEERNFSWGELFGKDKETKRNARCSEAVQAKWEIFKELHYNYGMNPTQIASWCKMDHTSVLYGLGKLKKKVKDK